MRWKADEEGESIINIVFMRSVVITRLRVTMRFLRPIFHDTCTLSIWYLTKTLFLSPIFADLGMIYNYLLELSRLLYINIMAYDYSGYGPKSISNMIQDVKPSEENCYENINAAYEHLTTIEMIRPQDVVLYGRSVGSGPSCYLAEKLCKYKENQIGGLILHSPFLSVVRVVLDMGLENSYDVFP